MSKVSKPSVNYRPSTGTRRCGNCDMYSAVLGTGQGSCTLVVGSIDPEDVCDKWEAKQK